MAIKRGSKVDPSFSTSSMSDIVFLLLVFLLIATTMINPNAVRLTLPKSSNQITEKPYTTVSITSDLRYYVETEPVAFSDLEDVLRAKLGPLEEPTISLHCDENVPMKETIKVINIAKDNRYRLILATRPN
ncbi:MAG: biopolymer transporter ExbD [Rikenellaceae bacterium]|nr:biopolymer transporter ExbD [Rikenellaceae bacterium]